MIALRPHALDYINGLVDDFHAIHGDRNFGDDHSMVTGFGHLEGKRVCLIGIEKGRKTKEKIHHNFGMPRPEGYRKALRVMKLAERFNLPIITFVDTPGAYPGIDAEERGQAQAIAENIAQMFDLKTPIISYIIGEGGSGGALGIAVADRVIMLEFSIYSVISPESCASILWSDAKRAPDAAESLKIDAKKAAELGVVDTVLEEPQGGAHRHHEKALALMKKDIIKNLNELKAMELPVLMKKRFEKFRQMGHSSMEEQL